MQKNITDKKKGLGMEEEKKLKGLFVGDMVAETGFATVMHNIIKNIKDEIDITGVGVNYNGDPHDFDFPIYPAMIGGRGNIYGIDRVCALLNSTEYDFLFILNDAWVISYYLDAIKKDVKKKLPKIIVYFPVDSKGHDRHWYQNFDIVTKAYTYTEFGKYVVNEKDCAPNLELGIMPHGVDSNDFYKIHETRSETRRLLFGDRAKDYGNLDNLFIVLNANRNQPRKKLDITMAGFSIFAKDKPKTVRLYMHSGVRDASIDILKEAERYHITDRLIISSLNPGIQRVSKAKLNMIYNACDIGINTGLGEGWGLTNVEHAATGAAQIVPRHSACEELFSDCGLLMETITDWTFDASETIGRLTTPSEVARCLDVLYNDRNLLSELSSKARKKFISEEYEWRNIALRWQEIFEEACKNDTTTISE